MLAKFWERRCAEPASFGVRHGAIPLCVGTLVRVFMLIAAEVPLSTEDKPKPLGRDGRHLHLTVYESRKPYTVALEVRMAAGGHLCAIPVDLKNDAPALELNAAHR